MSGSQSKKKKRLLGKQNEVYETWNDILTFMSSYLDNLKCAVDAVLKETDSFTFYKMYPKVSNHMDKILNIFVEVQCELDILSSDNILNYGVCNLRVKDEHDSPPVKVCSTPEIERNMRLIETEDSIVLESNKVVQEQCDSPPLPEASSEKESVDVSYVSFVKSDKKDEITVIACDQFPSVDSTRVSEQLEPAEVNTSLNKRRITQCVLKPNEILEMVYSHGDNPWNFWLCYYPYSESELIRDKIRSLFQANQLDPFLCLPDVGDNVLIADGEKFLRGQVLIVRSTEILENTSVMVLDVDSGIMKSFKLRDMWKIPEELVSIQAQAVNCQLQGILGDCSIWTKENLKMCKMLHKFEELLMESTLSVKIVKSLEDSRRYIIDADCINLETDKIFNVTQLINDIIIPHISCKSEGEVCFQKDSTQLQKSPRAATPVSHCDSYESMGSNIAKSHVSTVDEMSASFISELLPGPAIDSGPAATKTQYSELHEITADTNYQKVCDPRTDCHVTKLQSFDLSEISEPSITIEKNIDEFTECEIDITGVEIEPMQNDECILSVMRSIYCSKDIVLEKRNYSFLLNQTVLGFPKFIDSPGLFYMQFLLNEKDEFPELHEQMIKFYFTNKVKFSTKEAARNFIKSYCVALYPQDGQWYRAEIIDWMPSSETLVCVNFVDVGDKMVIEIDVIQPLAKQFAKVPVLAQKCHLYGVAPVECTMYSYVSYEWSPSSLFVFRNVFDSGHLCDMQVLELSSYGSVGVLLVDPECPETSINKKLIVLGEAKYLPSGDNLSLWDPMKEEYERYQHVPYNDEDACLAVSGYSPNDEKRFCKFYAKNGKCFKGSNCKKEHVLSHPGGWISDKAEIFKDAFTQIVLPEIGETVYLQVTCVVRINLFYIILNIDDSAEDETLLTLNKYINDKKNLMNMRKLDVTPAVGQLVLAHYQQDGIWYRARVVDTDTDNSLIQVFFVDYGNTEWVSEVYIRDIDPQYLHLPFQAIESSLAFAEMNTSVADDSLETVISAFRSLTNCIQPLRAKIISKDNILKKLELQLYDINDHDIALLLADTGYVNITHVQLTPATAFALPG